MRPRLASLLIAPLVVVACRQEAEPVVPTEPAEVVEAALERSSAHAVTISSGRDHSCVMLQDRPWCWGADQPLPVRRAGPSPGPLLAGVTDMDSAAGSMCVVAEGRLRCFGRSVPVGVEGITDVELAARHACGVLDTGHVRCWGENGWGQLGAGTREQKRGSNNHAVDPGVADAVAVAVGTHHSCALTESGQVFCWGNSEPSAKVAGMGAVLVPGIPPAHRIAAGDHGRSCAIFADGRVRCWQLHWSDPRQTLVDAIKPAETVTGIRGPVELDMDGRHACAREKEGDVVCWGVNHRGVLGDGTFSNRPKLARRIEGLEGALEMAVGADHVCVRTAGDEVHCWGDNTGRELGLAGAAAVTPTPFPVQAVSGVRAMALGSRHTCVESAGGPLCWGDNEQGQLGHLPTANEPQWRGQPMPWRAGRGETVAGEASTCTRAGNKLTCVGKVAALRRGASEAEMELRLRNAEQVELASDGTWGCSRHRDGAVRCFGTLPWQSCLPEIDKCTPKIFGPTKVKALDTAAALTVGRAHACALLDDGHVACWGTNAFGQAGVPETTTPRANSSVVDGVADVRAVGAGWAWSCALDGDGEVWCWGSATSSESSHVARALEGLPPASELSVGPNHACAVTEDARLWCWGANQFGQLGSGQTSAALSDSPPTQVELADVKHVKAGAAHTCATTGDGALHCWGANERGQLGTGMPAAALEPVRVQGLGEGLDTGDETKRETGPVPVPEPRPQPQPKPGQ